MVLLDKYIFASWSPTALPVVGKAETITVNTKGKTYLASLYIRAGSEERLRSCSTAKMDCSQIVHIAKEPEHTLRSVGVFFNNSLFVFQRDSYRNPDQYACPELCLPILGPGWIGGYLSSHAYWGIGACGIAASQACYFSFSKVNVKLLQDWSCHCSGSWGFIFFQWSLCGIACYEWWGRVSTGGGRSWAVPIQGV